MLESMGSQGVRHNLREQQVCLMKDQFLSVLENFAVPCACQAPLSMEFSRQEYWSGLPSLSPGDLPYPGIGSHIAGRFFTIWTTGEARYFITWIHFSQDTNQTMEAKVFSKWFKKAILILWVFLLIFKCQVENMFQASPINLNWLTVGTLSIEHKEIPIFSEDM